MHLGALHQGLQNLNSQQLKGRETNLHFYQRSCTPQIRKLSPSGDAGLVLCLAHSKASWCSCLLLPAARGGEPAPRSRSVERHQLSQGKQGQGAPSMQSAGRLEAES